MGDCFTALNAVLNSIKRFRHCFFMGKILGKFHKILNETCLLIDNRQGVVDFMGNTCRQPADGCKFVAVSNFPIEELAFFIRFSNVIGNC